MPMSVAQTMERRREERGRDQGWVGAVVERKASRKTAAAGSVRTTNVAARRIRAEKDGRAASNEGG
jgi:hypothetical protein